MRLIVTGGSSFLGAWFCRVAARAHEVHALYHSTPLALNGVHAHRVDLCRPLDVARVARLHADVVVHLACQIRARPRGAEAPSEAAVRVNRQMMDAVLSFGLPTVYASSTVVSWQTDTPYGRSRRDDEARLAASGLPWAVLRPSAPYGPALLEHHPGHRESFHSLAAWVARAPIVPVLGSGHQRRQPVHVEDFAQFVLGLLYRGLPNRAFEAGGADALSMREIVRTMGASIGRSPRVMPIPVEAVAQVARWMPDMEPSLVRAAVEDECADPQAIIEASGHHPRPFAEGAADVFRSGFRPRNRK